jgi:hypothetical protein
VEIGNEIRFDNNPFTIKDIIYRTPGSDQQRLISKKDVANQEIVDGRVFYLVESDGVTYWVKHYVHGDFGMFGDATYEYDRMRDYGEYQIDSRSISPVKVHACENNMILMDYCQYPRLNELHLMRDERDAIDDLAAQWVRKFNVADYDMCCNNTLVKVCGDVIDVKLVDFETAARNKPYEHFIKHLITR